MAVADVECYAWTPNGMVATSVVQGAYVRTRDVEELLEAAHERGRQEGERAKHAKRLETAELDI
jgi:hypothetical protein